MAYCLVISFIVYQIMIIYNKIEFVISYNLFDMIYSNYNTNAK